MLELSLTYYLVAGKIGVIVLCRWYGFCFFEYGWQDRRMMYGDIALFQSYYRILKSDYQGDGADDVRLLRLLCIGHNVNENLTQ